jgi:hypothetical protein
MARAGRAFPLSTQFLISGEEAGVEEHFGVATVDGGGFVFYVSSTTRTASITVNGGGTVTANGSKTGVRSIVVTGGGVASASGTKTALVSGVVVTGGGTVIIVAHDTVIHSGSSHRLITDSIEFWAAYDLLATEAERLLLLQRFLLRHGGKWVKVNGVHVLQGGFYPTVREIPDETD